MTAGSLLDVSQHGSSIAVAGPQGELTYNDLERLVDARASSLSESPAGLLLHLVRNDVDGIVSYLAALRSHRSVAMLDPEIDPDALSRLTDLYRPAVVAGSGHDVDGYRRSGTDLLRVEEPATVHPELAVLLPTSGSTGSPKMVRLSRCAVVSNAASIVESLGIDSSDRAPLNLALHYSYGLSVLNSHLLAGATVVPTEKSFMQKDFWELFDDERCTSLAGVPYSYQMLRRLRFSAKDHPSLRSMTQAGGRLADALVAEFHEQLSESGVEFFVMYGQTEATARMAVMPPDELPTHLGSAGRAIPGGRFEIVDGEVVYEGPNVMMGYAAGADDLRRGDDLRGRLHTGDLGDLDDEGFLWLTGRAKRIGKVFGTRISLDDIEDLLSTVGPSAALASDDRVIIYIETEDGAVVKRLLRDRLRIPPSGFDVRLVDELPRRSNGKTDYGALESQ